MSNKILLQIPVYKENLFDADNQEILQHVMDQLKLDKSGDCFVCKNNLYKIYESTAKRYNCYKLIDDINRIELKDHQILEKNKEMVREINYLTKENENLNVENRKTISEDLFFKSLAAINGKRL